MVVVVDIVMFVVVFEVFYLKVNGVVLFVMFVVRLIFLFGYIDGLFIVICGFLMFCIEVFEVVW